jgi:hypothetical protein
MDQGCTRGLLYSCSKLGKHLGDRYGTKPYVIPFFYMAGDDSFIKRRNSVLLHVLGWERPAFFQPVGLGKAQ